MKKYTPGTYNFRFNRKWNVGYTLESLPQKDGKYWIVGIWQMNILKYMFQRKIYPVCLVLMVLMGLITKHFLDFDWYSYLQITYEEEEDVSL